MPQSFTRVVARDHAIRSAFGFMGSSCFFPTFVAWLVRIKCKIFFAACELEGFEPTQMPSKFDPCKIKIWRHCASISALSSIVCQPHGLNLFRRKVQAGQLVIMATTLVEEMAELTLKEPKAWLQKPIHLARGS